MSGRCDVVALYAKGMMKDDLDKSIGESNKTKSGGGARDIRLRRVDMEVVKTLFPLVADYKTEARGLFGDISKRTIPTIERHGLFYVDEHGDHSPIPLSRPTLARKGEYRIPNYGRYPLLFPPTGNVGDNELLMVLYRCLDGRCYVEYLLIEDMKESDFPNDVKEKFDKELLCKRERDAIQFYWKLDVLQTIVGVSGGESEEFSGDAIDYRAFAMSEDKQRMARRGSSSFMVNRVAENHMEDDSGSQGQTDWVGRQKKSQELGLQGEKLVCAKIRAWYEMRGRADLSKDICAVCEGTLRDGCGYDIKAYDIDSEKEVYIEVKTTCSGASSWFYASANEIDFSDLHKDAYQLVRIYSLDIERGSCKFMILKGSILDTCNLKPTHYAVVPY